MALPRLYQLPDGNRTWVALDAISTVRYFKKYSGGSRENMHARGQSTYRSQSLTQNKNATQILTVKIETGVTFTECTFKTEDQAIKFRDFLAELSNRFSKQMTGMPLDRLYKLRDGQWIALDEVIVVRTHRQNVGHRTFSDQNTKQAFATVSDHQVGVMKVETEGSYTDVRYEDSNDAELAKNELAMAVNAYTTLAQGHMMKHKARITAADLTAAGLNMPSPVAAAPMN